jgi:Tfp pilus assembly protein PilO
MMRPGRRRLLIALAAVLGLNLLVYLAFTLPRSLQRRNLGSRMTVAREEVDRERQRVASLRASHDLVSANTRDASEFFSRSIGLRGASMVPLLREVETVARERGLRVGNQSFSFEPVKGAPLDRFIVKMPMRGTYRELAGFVEALEQSRLFVTLDEITVYGQQAGQAELQMVLSCYFRSNPGKQGT